MRPAVKLCFSERLESVLYHNVQNGGCGGLSMEFSAFTRHSQAMLCLELNYQGKTEKTIVGHLVGRETYCHVDSSFYDMLSLVFLLSRYFDSPVHDETKNDILSFRTIHWRSKDSDD